MRVQSDHWAVTLDFAEQHPEIITNKLKSMKGREGLQQSWKELTVMLNSLGMGEKTTEEWKKTIIDWKSKTKAKSVSIRTHLGGTGGGPPPNIMLTAFEKRLLATMGKVAVEGNPKVAEIGLKRSVSSSLMSAPEQQPTLKQIKLTKPIFLTLRNSQCTPLSTTLSQTNKNMGSMINKEYMGLINEWKENSTPKNDQTPSADEALDETFSFAGQTHNQPIPIRGTEKPQQKGILKMGSCNMETTQVANESCIIFDDTTHYSEIENNTTPSTSTNRRASSRRRDTYLGERLESMNNSVLTILERIDNKLEKIGDRLGELVDVIKDLKK